MLNNNAKYQSKTQFATKPLIPMGNKQTKYLLGKAHRL